MSRSLFVRAAALVLALAPLLSLAACGSSEPEAITPASLAKAAAAVGSVNGLCPIMERLVAPDGGSVEYKGQKVAFCCPGCSGKFRADADRYIALMKANPAKYGYKP